MNKKNKYNLGGILSGLSNTALPGSGIAIDMFLNALKTRGMSDLNSQPLTQNNNPFGIMRNGGDLSQPTGFKQYDAASHEIGGQNVDDQGNIVSSGMNEIEKKENKYTYSNGKTYVFSDANDTASKVKDIINKFKSKDTSADFATKNAMEQEIKKVERLNEAINTARSAVENVMQARYGKELQYGGDPNAIDDTVLNTDNEIDLRTSPHIPASTFTPMVAMNYNPDAPIQPLPTINPLSSDMGFADTKARLDDVYSNPNKTNSNNILGNIDFPGVLRTAGIVGSGIDAFQRPDVEETILPDYSTSDDRFNSMNADLTQARQDALSASNRASELNRNAASSYNQYRAREINNIGNLQDAMGRIGMNEQQLRNQIAQTQGQYEANKAITDARIKDDVQQRNLANKARVQDLRKQFMSDIVHEADRLSTSEDIRNISQAKIKEGMSILKQIAPDFTINEDFVTNLIKVSKGELDVSKLNDQELIVFNKLNNGKQ